MNLTKITGKLKGLSCRLGLHYWDDEAYQPGETRTCRWCSFCQKLIEIDAGVTGLDRTFERVETRKVA